jgi:hypothetical protein
MRFALRPGDLLRSFHSARRLRLFLAFGRSTRRLSAANSLARVALSCVGFTLAVSPSSTSRRIASERVASLAVAQPSTSTISVTGIRVVAGGSRPVGGLPARAFGEPFSFEPHARSRDWFPRPGRNPAVIRPAEPRADISKAAGDAFIDAAPFDRGGAPGNHAASSFSASRLMTAFASLVSAASVARSSSRVCWSNFADLV